MARNSKKVYKSYIVHEIMKICFYDRSFIGFISGILDGGKGTHPTCNIRTVKYDGCAYLRWSWINKARLQR